MNQLFSESQKKSVKKVSPNVSEFHKRPAKSHIPCITALIKPLSEYWRRLKRWIEKLLKNYWKMYPSVSKIQTMPAKCQIPCSSTSLKHCWLIIKCLNIGDWKMYWCFFAKWLFESLLKDLSDVKLSLRLNLFN